MGLGLILTERAFKQNIGIEPSPEGGSDAA